MAKHKILYLSYDGLTDPLGQSQILPYIIGLSKNEYEFTVVSFEKPLAFAALMDETKIICKENNIQWQPLKYHKWPPVLSTLYDIWGLWQRAKKNYRREEISIIHCRSYITSLVGLQAKKRWGVKFIFDMRGFWADERVEAGLWNLKNPIYRSVYNFFKKKEKQFIAEADHIISLTHNAKNEIGSWGIEHAPITVIPTCVDLDLFDPTKINPEDQTAWRKKLGIDQNDFILLYLGSWGTWYSTREMLNFFAYLKQERRNAKFLVVSPNKIEVTGYPYKEDVIFTSASRKQVPCLISLANASICLVKQSFSKKASSATKLSEIMAMGIPVIVNQGWGDIDYILHNNKERIPLTNFVSKNFNENYRVLNSTGWNQEEYSLTGGVKTYQSLYEKLMARANG